MQGRKTTISFLARLRLPHVPCLCSSSLFVRLSPCDDSKLTIILSLDAGAPPLDLQAVEAQKRDKDAFLLPVSVSHPVARRDYRKTNARIGGEQKCNL